MPQCWYNLSLLHRILAEAWHSILCWCCHACVHFCFELIAIAVKVQMIGSHHWFCSNNIAGVFCKSSLLFATSHSNNLLIRKSNYALASLTHTLDFATEFVLRFSPTFLSSHSFLINMIIRVGHYATFEDWRSYFRTMFNQVIASLSQKTFMAYKSLLSKI